LKGGSGNSNFLPTVKYVFTHLHELRPSDTLLGIGSIMILLALRKLKDIKTPEGASKGKRTIGGLLWLISTARNAILVLLSSIAAYYAYEKGNFKPFILTGEVKAGLPSVSLPPFQTNFTNDNGTVVEMDTMDMISELGSSIALVPIIAVLGNVAISKAFGGSGIDATKELIALSLSNIIGSFFSSMPVTGSFSRSAVNHASGVKTPIGGVYTGILVLLALSVLTPYFQYIPRAALSSVIISAVIFMIEYEVVKPLWRCSRRELFTVTLTLVLSLLVGVEIGLLSGVFLDIAFVIQRTARPVLSFSHCESRSGINYMMLKPRHSLLCFPATEYIRTGINNAIMERERTPSFVVMDFRNVQELDYTAAKGIGNLKKELAGRKIILIILGSNEEIKLVLKASLKAQNVIQVENDDQLEIVLEEQSCCKIELKDVIAPLLMQENEDDIMIVRRESQRRE
jgi:solute carrier family 26 (sodium-independent sulfate anion transporter), member 11